MSAQSPAAWLRDNHAFAALCVLLVAAFLMGGSSRGDIFSLILLRPLAVLCLGIGLAGLTAREISEYRFVLGGALLVLLLVGLHLVPLPPSIWTGLAGRDVAVVAGEAAGIGQPWRPLTLVPWRGWNSFYALLVPFAALVLAIRCTPQQQNRLAYVILAMMLLALLWAVVQVAGGYRRALYLYRVSSEDVPTGLFANRNHFAAMIACCLPLLALIAPRDRIASRGATLRLWLISIGGGAGLLVLLMTGSRAGLAVALLALASLPLVVRQPDGAAGARRRRLVLIGLGIAGALVVGTLAVLMSRAESIARLMATQGEDELRFSSWGPIADMVSGYLPMGSGAGSFVEVYRMWEPRELLGTSYLNHAHNDWLEVVLEFGVPGALLLTAAVMAWALRSIWLLRNGPVRTTGNRQARAGAIIILLLALASIPDYPLRVPSVGCVFAIAAGWMASARRRARPDAERRREEAL